MPDFSFFSDIDLVGGLAMGALCFAASGMALLLLGGIAQQRERTRLVSQPAMLSDGCVFIFRGRTLLQASDTAQQLLDKNARSGESAWDLIVRCHREACPGIARMLDDLVQGGKAFLVDVSLDNETFIQIEGVPRGSVAALYLRDVSDDRREKLILQRDLYAVEGGLADMVSALKSAPVLAWHRNLDGNVQWLTDAAAVPFAPSSSETLGAACIAASAPAVHGELQSLVLERPDKRSLHIDLVETPTQAGGIIGVAVDKTETVNAKETLTRFVNTLTETFAHLPTGLAIFDAEGRLSLFNPALSDLLHLDPAWLASAPKLRAFMDQLRERSMVPEQTDLKSWLKLVGRIEQQAQAGSLVEKWVLPSGQTFQITGRPHPNDAMALLFEDISYRATLEQKYRSEIEMSAATLDRLSESVAVFDTAGALVYVNSAFIGLWGIDPMKSLDAPTIVDLSRHWGRLTKPSPTWADLRDFATGADERAQWDARVEMTDGRQINGTFAPMPDGSTLTVFEDVSGEATLEREKAAVLRSARVERNTSSALLDLRSDDLITTINVLRDAVTTSDLPAEKVAELTPILDAAMVRHEALTIDSGPAPETSETVAPVDMVDRLKHLAKSHGGHHFDLSMTVGEDSIEDNPVLSRSLFNIVLVAKELARDRTDLNVTVVGLEDGHAMSCLFPGKPERPTALATECLPFRVLKRFAAEAGGSASLEQLEDDETIKVSCVIPKQPDNRALTLLQHAS